MQKVGIKLL